MAAPLRGDPRFLVCQGRNQRLNRDPEWWKIVLYDLPDDVVRNLMVPMSEDIPDAGDTGPTNLGLRGFQFDWEMTAGFGNDLKTALNRVIEKPVGLKFGKCLLPDCGLDPVDRP